MRPHRLDRTPFHCSPQMILPSHFTSKNPQKLPHKVSNYNSTTIISGRLVKTPLFLDCTMQVQLVKNTPKTCKMTEPIDGLCLMVKSPPAWVIHSVHCSSCRAVSVCCSWACMHSLPPLPYIMHAGSWCCCSCCLSQELT